MANVIKKNFSNPDELREPDKMKVEFLEFPSGKVARLTSQPGWTWTECVSPIAGTETCQAHHLGVVTKGDLTIFGDDGSEETFGPGDAYESVIKEDDSKKSLSDIARELMLSQKFEKIANEIKSSITKVESLS